MNGFLLGPVLLYEGKFWGHKRERIIEEEGGKGFQRGDDQKGEGKKPLFGKNLPLV